MFVSDSGTQFSPHAKIVCNNNFNNSSVVSGNCSGKLIEFFISIPPFFLVFYYQYRQSTSNLYIKLLKKFMNLLKRDLN